MTRKDIITNSGYWEEYANLWKYNKSTDVEIAKDILRVINEALNIADVGKQRELLIAFKTWETENDIKNLKPDQLADFFLEDGNL